MDTQRRREWLILGPLFLGVAFFALNFQLVKVAGPSMDPTLKNHQTMLVWRTGSLFRPYRAGDVIVFNHDGDEYVKRIVFVQKSDGSARLPLWLPTSLGSVPTGVLLSAAGVNEFPQYSQQIRDAQRGKPVTEPIFVMGDNAWDSEDSRDFGPISPDAIMGRVIFPIPRLPVIANDIPVGSRTRNETLPPGQHLPIYGQASRASEEPRPAV